MPPDERTERTSVSLPTSLAARLSYEARRTNRSVSAVVRDALTRYLSEEPDELPAFVGMVRTRKGLASRVDEEIAAHLDEERPRITGRE
jgi:predicted DNA-binding protein